jgi:hypothetical protein
LTAAFTSIFQASNLASQVCLRVAYSCCTWSKPCAIRSSAKLTRPKAASMLGDFDDEGGPTSAHHSSGGSAQPVPACGHRTLAIAAPTLASSATAT